MKKASLYNELLLLERILLIFYPEHTWQSSLNCWFVVVATFVLSRTNNVRLAASRRTALWSNDNRLICGLLTLETSFWSNNNCLVSGIGRLFLSINDFRFAQRNWTRFSLSFMPFFSLMIPILSLYYSEWILNLLNDSLITSYARGFVANDFGLVWSGTKNVWRLSFCVEVMYKFFRWKVKFFFSRWLHFPK